MAVVGSLQRLAAPLVLPAGRRLCSSSVGKEVYDLVVVGGGMVGSALACSVGREPSFSHKRVLLLESNPSPPRPVKADDTYSNRVSTLSLGSVDLMKRIGAWQAITELRTKAFTQLHVWDACSEARLVFNNQTSHDFGTIVEGVSHDQEAVPEDDIIGSSYRSIVHDVTSDDIMGYIVENKVIMAALLDVLEDCNNVEVRRGVRTLEVQPPTADCKDDPSSPWVELTLNSGETISTRLLVGSDGPNSRIRHLCDFQHVGWKYDQSALLTTLHIHALNDNNTTAWQRFLPPGPIAMLPLSDTLSSLIWSTTPSHAQSLLELPEERFVDAVNTAFWDPFPQDDLVTTVNEAVRDALAVLNTDSPPPPPRQLPPTVSGIVKDSRAAFPLSLGHAPFYVKPRIALIGDAAHTVHVMAGQGLNLGFRDVVSLTHCLLQANSRGADWGSLSTLLEYETARQRHNVPMAATIEGLYHLFSTSWTPAVLLRSLGFQITNAVPPIKHFFMEQAQRAK